MHELIGLLIGRKSVGYQHLGILSLCHFNSFGALS